MEKLERVQYQAALAITGAWQDSNCSKLNEELGWETLFDRRMSRRILQIHKFMKNKTPSYLKDKLPPKKKLKLQNISEASTRELINTMDRNKPSTYNNIPTKILIGTNYIISPIITEMYNESKLKCDFPHSLKLAEITPAHKTAERTMKHNYRPAISKIFEKNMYNQIYAYIDKYLSPYLCGFRTGFSTQHCLVVMLERWKKACFPY